MPIRIMIIDDHSLVRAGLRRVLEDNPDIDVVAEAGSGEEALDNLRETPVDVVLMDINMPGIGGLEATRRILQRFEKVKIIAVSMHMEEPYPSQFLSAGAAGYMGKDAEPKEMATAIRTVFKGQHYIAASVAGALAASMARGRDHNPFDSLSQREMQVMLMMTEGASNQQISNTLSLSPKTVSTYRSRLFEKLAVDNTVELTKKAMRYGVLDAEPPSSNT